MATIQAVLQHHRLYDQIYTLYGPFYYLLEWVFYGVTGLAVTHDCVRLIAFMLWPISSALIAWSAYRLSGSLLLTAFAFLATIKLLRFFSLEPGHPEEICMVLLAVLLALVCSNSSSLSLSKAACYGFLLSALTMTKINIGLYASLALLLSLSATRPKSLSRMITFVAMAGAAVFLIIGIMSQLFQQAWARNYCCEVVVSLVALVIVVWFTASQVQVDRSSWAILAAGFAVTSFASVFPFLLRGTTLNALLYITVFQHKDFARHWFRASPFGENAIAWSLVSLGLSALWASMYWRRQSPDTLRTLLQLLKGALGLIGAYVVLVSPFETIPIGSQIMRAIAPFCWLLLVQPLAAGVTTASFTRVSVCFFSVFVTLYSFPVAGSQSLFAVVPLMIVVSGFLHDAAVELVAVRPLVFEQRVQQVVSAAVLLLLAGFYVRESFDAYRDYARGVPLGLPGAKLIRVSPVEAETYQALVHELDARCPSFFSMPGLFSLYFWTHKNPPTLLMMNDWPAFFGSRQQEFILSDLKRAGTSCIVYNPALVEFLRAGQDVSSLPLARFIRLNFQTVDARNGYQLMLLKRTSEVF